MTFTPPTHGGVGPRVTFSNPIQETNGGTDVRNTGSKLSLITCDTDVSTCGHSASNKLFSQLARSTSGSFVHRGRCLNASANTSWGMGSGTGLASAVPDLAAAAALLALAVANAAASADASDPRDPATSRPPRSNPMHVPKM